MAALPPMLVVDDSDDDLHFMKRLLAKAAVKNPIVTFNDTGAVIAFLKAASSSPESGLLPCLLFTDLKMPGMSGIELLKWIRSQSALAHVPIVIVSGGKEENEITRAKALGADKYLVKLPTAEAMANVIAELCGHRAKA